MTSQRTQRLELTWIGKEVRPKLEPRVLLEDSSQSYHAAAQVSGSDQYDNRLIYGDNLLALKALEQEFSGKIKCVFIDPPYNTGAAFEHYDDGIEHSTWLSLIRDRIQIIHRLLKNDGCLWITIDDNEAHYLKIVCDEIFGRKNFVATFAWEKDKGRRNDTDISSAYDHVLLFAKDRDVWGKCRNPLPRTDVQKSRYRNPDDDPRGPWLQGDNGTAKQSGTIAGRQVNGHKGTTLEGGSRVPLIANWPGVTPQGKVLNDLVDFSDFFPTFAEAAGGKMPTDVKIDGHSFAPQLRGKRGNPREWLFVQLDPKWYARNDGWKLDQSGDLFDLSDAPFVEKLVSADTESSAAKAARQKLRAVLDELNPAAGKNSTPVSRELKKARRQRNRTGTTAGSI